MAGKKSSIATGTRSGVKDKEVIDLYRPTRPSAAAQSAKKLLEASEATSTGIEAISDSVRRIRAL